MSSTDPVPPAAAAVVEEAHDVCALPLVQRVAAILDRDPASFRTGDKLPRGWHVALFTVATPQSLLRADGLAGLGVTLPDLGLPTIMAGGKRTRFDGDIAIGAAVRRASRVTSVATKEGRSGRFALVGIEHRVFAEGHPLPVLVDEQDYVMRGEQPAKGAAAAPPASPPERPRADVSLEMTPTETLLLRYCAITFNTHRIHYDLPYAREQEGYPALVVNGGLPLIFLLELFRKHAGREPAAVAGRNLAPLYCGRPMRLCAVAGEPEWRLWAEDETGRPALEVSIR